MQSWYAVTAIGSQRNDARRHHVPGVQRSTIAVERVMDLWSDPLPSLADA
jgi:hypothetical protein